MKKSKLWMSAFIILLTFSCTSNDAVKELEEIKDELETPDDDETPDVDNSYTLYGITGTCNGNGTTANLVTVNPNDGVTSIVSDVNLYKSQSVTFNADTNEFYYADYSSSIPKLLKVNVTDGTSSTIDVTFPNEFCHLKELYFNLKNQSLYGIMGTCNGNGTTSNLVTINPNDGSTSIVSDVNLYKSQSVTFNANSNEFYYADYASTIPKLLKVNIADGTSSTIELTFPNEFCHLDELYYNSNNKKLYGVMGTCNGNGTTANLVTINPNDGSTSIVSDVNLYKAQSVTFNRNTNEFYYADYSIANPKLLKVNILDGTSNTIDVTFLNNFCHLDELYAKK